MPTALKNTIRLDVSSNSDLKAIFDGKKPNDKCSVTIRIQVTEINEKEVVGLVEKVTSDYDEEKKAEPTPETPFSISIQKPDMDADY